MNRSLMNFRAGAVLALAVAAMPGWAHDPAVHAQASNAGAQADPQADAGPGGKARLDAGAGAAIEGAQAGGTVDARTGAGAGAGAAADAHARVGRPALPGGSSAARGQDLSRYLFDAARAGDIEVLASLVARGVEVDARDERGSTALILAAYHGQADAVQALLAAGASPNLGDSARGNTPLMGALFKGESESARRLLADPRTDVNARNAAGQTAAMFAALFGRADLIEALAARVADFALADGNGATAETLARMQGNAELADRLAALAGKRSR